MISVVVPVYNVYLFIEECIESICNQTYADLEILLIDDGSTDQSGVLCDAYVQKDSRIKVIHQENKGLSGARNTGILQAKGEYIVFVDSDDRIHPMMIQTLYDVMQQYDAEISICSHKIIQEREDKESICKALKIGFQDIEVLSGRECIKRSYSREAIDMVVAWNKLYRKSMFCQLKYPIGRLHEDEFLTYKILYPLKKCVYVKAPLYEYRVREGSIMENKNINRLKDKMDAFEEKCIFFEQKGDLELYHEILRRYETSIAELILYLKENNLEVEFVQELYHKFQVVYREKVVASKIAFQHKLKYIIFMKNSTIYKILKKLDDKINRKK